MSATELRFRPINPLTPRRALESTFTEEETDDLIPHECMYNSPSAPAL